MQGTDDSELTARRRQRTLEEIRAALDAINREYERLRGRPLLDEDRRKREARDQEVA